MARGRLRIGTAGWSYRDWKGRFYPSAPSPGFDALTYYAEHFDTVEVNTTFYRIPRHDVVAAWAERAPDGFVFAVKLLGELSHGDAPATAAAFGPFVDALRPLVESGKLGCVLAQFPPSFRPHPSSFDVLTALPDRLAGIPAVVEFRHADWMSPRRRPVTVELLRSLGLGFVNVDEPQVRGNMPPSDVRTSEIGYVRLHGRNAPDWWPRIPRRRAEAFRRAIARTSASTGERTAREGRLDAALEIQKAQRYNYLYSRLELTEWLPRIEQIRRQAATTFIVTNNHYLGQAVANAKMLQRLLGESVRGATEASIEELIATGEAEPHGAPRPDSEWKQLVADLAR